MARELKKGEKRVKNGQNRGRLGTLVLVKKKHFTPPKKLGDLYGTPTPKSTLRRVKSHPPPGGPPPCFQAKFPKNWAFFIFQAKFGEQSDENEVLANSSKMTCY